MAGDTAITLKNVSKVFKRYHHPADRLKEIFLPGKQRAEEFWALQNINLEIPKGETIGIIGRNGSGKSTLLQIIAGTLQPTTGTVQVNGRVSALLELGSGFNPEFTGRQNVFFNGRILGLSQEQIEERFDEIAAFADIGEFIDQPVKTYSSGMFVRLAFAVAVHVEPEVLIVDEALAVGDMVFQQRCTTKIKYLRDEGISIFFVSHDLDAVKRLCDRAAVLEKGSIVNQGTSLRMANWYVNLATLDFNLNRINSSESSPDNHESSVYYTDILANQNDLIAPNRNNSQNQFEFFRHGDGKAKIVSVIAKNSNGEKTDSVKVGESISIVVEADFFAGQETYLIGIVIRDRLGTDIIGINTYQENFQVPLTVSGDKIFYEFRFDMHVKPGHYGICPSISYGQHTMKWMDWIDNALVIRVLDTEAGRTVFGIYLPPYRDIKSYIA